MKNGIAYCLIIICCLYSCSGKKDKYLNFNGEKIDATSAVKEKQMTASASFSEGYRVTYKHCSFFMIADSSGTIRYASTNDKNFIVDNTFSIGTTFSSIKSDSVTTGYYQPGWAYIIPLKANWHAGFLDSAVLQNRKPSDTSKVTFIYWNKK